MKQKIRVGIVGGGMGRFHMEYIHELLHTDYTAFCDINPQILDNICNKYKVQGFTDYKEMINSGLIDAIVVATPHTLHPEICIYAFNNNIHVLTEKPVAVHINQAIHMNNAHLISNVKYAAMFQYRTLPVFQKVKELIAAGQLGKIMRINWICTNWFRTQAYYDSSSWRATWSGEGGGVLLNQCPHNLDILQWLLGMPESITANCFLGKHHVIEVEDEVSAFMQWKNGATGTFITSTGESPGTDRLEICGDIGTVIVENNGLTFKRNTESAIEYSKTSNKIFPTLASKKVRVDLPKIESGHKVITQNFINAILYKAPLIAPGEEGLNSLMLSNAILISGLTNKTINLPLEGNTYEIFLKRLIKNESVTV